MHTKTASFGPLSGPFRAANNESATALVILLHGYGANGHDLFDLANPIVSMLGRQDVAVWSPNAPDVLTGAPDAFGAREAFEWFPITQIRLDVVSRDAAKVIPVVRSAIMAATEALSIPTKSIVVVGFSQGGMVALEACTSMSNPVAGVVGLSTIFLGNAKAGQDFQPIPVTLIHGSDDQVVEPDFLTQSVRRLEALNVPVDHHLLAGLGHNIDQRAFDLMLRSIANWI